MNRFGSACASRLERAQRSCARGLALGLPLRFTPRQSWRPITDAEWDALAPIVTSPWARGGRPAGNPRRLWDAIFWMAATRHPWRMLPAHLGKPESVSKALRRHARAGLLDRLLVAVSPHPLATEGLRALAWFICRAWRRAVRVMAPASLLLVRRLGLAEAMPAAPWFLPDPGLSETLRALHAWVFADPLRRLTSGMQRTLFALARLAAGDRRRWRVA
jgi:transposase